MKKAGAELVSSLLFWWCFYSCSSLSFAVETNPGLLKKFLSYKLRKVKICSKIFWARISKVALVLGYPRAVRLATAKHKRTAEAKALNKAAMFFTVNFAMLDFSTTTIFLLAQYCAAFLAFPSFPETPALYSFTRQAFQFCHRLFIRKKRNRFFFFDGSAGITGSSLASCSPDLRGIHKQIRNPGREKGMARPVWHQF